jgi:methionyl-tRNA formyltransferase
LESKKSEYDLFLVVAYGKIMPKEILDIPKLRSFNIHYSLLPKYRGASPVEGAILNGETKTGVSIQQMEYKMDSGPIVAMKEIDIRNEETTPELKDRLIEIGAQLFIETFPKIIENKITKIAQDHNKATYTKKITKEDGLVDIEKEPAVNLYNKFRAYYAWPRIYFMKNGKRVIITDATFENGIFQIKKVIPEGKKEIKYEDFLNSSISK